MKATLTLCALAGLASAAVIAEPTALAWAITSQDVIRTPEPAWMVLSGASLITAASLVRRYVP